MAVERNIPDQHGAQTLDDWVTHLHVASVAHGKAASRSSLWSQILLVTLSMISAVVGGSILITLQSSPSFAAKVAAGSLSTLAAALAAIQAGVNLPARTVAYQKTSGKFGKLWRQAEQLREAESEGKDVEKEKTELRERYDVVEDEAPTASNRAWTEARKQVAAQ